MIVVDVIVEPDAAIILGSEPAGGPDQPQCVDGMPATSPTTGTPAAARRGSIDLDEERVAAWAREALQLLGRDEVELAVVLVDDAAIQGLNRDYLGRDRPTNVISFPQQEGEGLAGNHLGDIVISVERAITEARSADMAPVERFVQLLIHGICHLTGYNHEGVDEEEAARMERKEREIFARMRG